eukprot:PhM_4_TR15211/c0_g1_i1/m.56390
MKLPAQSVPSNPRWLVIYACAITVFTLWVLWVSHRRVGFVESEGCLTKAVYTTVITGGSIKTAQSVATSVDYKAPEEYVTTLQGTYSSSDHSNGNTLPFVARPYGQTYWTVMTKDTNSWFFNPKDFKFRGFMATHQPSPWIGDYGTLNFMPAWGKPSSSAGYNASECEWRPYYFRARLEPYCTLTSCLTLEATATTHGAALRIRFPPTRSGAPYGQDRHLLVELKGSTKVVASSSQSVNLTNADVQGSAANFLMRYNVHTSVPMTVNSISVDNINYADLKFGSDVNEVIVQVGGSMISDAQAQYILTSQVASLGFDDLVAQSKAVWNRHLSRVAVKSVGHYDSADTMLSTFYSSLYRASLFPRSLSEPTPNGETVHYSPYDANGKTYPGELSTDSGFWDAYRAVYPWLSVAYPERVGTLMTGWINAYIEGGWVPQWSSPGYRGSMVGTMSDVTFADAIVKNVGGFNATLAYQAMHKNAFEEPSGDSGRAGLDDYIKKGYVPLGGSIDQVVSRSLNYMHADWAIAQAATKLGYKTDADVLTERSSRFGGLFDPTVQMFRGKNADGSWDSNFDPISWDFKSWTEASAWQYRFYVPWNMSGLFGLYGGTEKVCSVMNETLFSQPAYHRPDGQGEIHEMIELGADNMGEYEHNNQPAHYMLYVALHAGCTDLSQRAIRRVLTTFYTPRGFAGDEDNGEMTSWYLLSSLGLYSVAPGSTTMTIGTPLFEHVQVQLPNNRTLDVVAPNNAEGTPIVSMVTWNGKAVTDRQIEYADLMSGGTLLFTMAP